MADLAPLVETLPLPPLEKRYLIDRWADQIDWMERKAKQAQQRYYALRLVTVVGAVIVPALASVTAIDNDRLSGAAKIATWAVSLLVAISAAVEQLHRYGELWRHYRQIAESLKSQGWLFFELSGPYAELTSHADAFKAFARNIEEIMKSDVQQYVTEVTAERKGGGTSTIPGGG